jgi:hypothetical protein
MRRTPSTMTAGRSKRGVQEFQNERATLFNGRRELRIQNSGGRISGDFSTLFTDSCLLP